MLLFLVLLTSVVSFKWNSANNDWRNYWSIESNTGKFPIICSPDSCPCRTMKNAYMCPKNQSQFLWFFGDYDGDYNALLWTYPVVFNRNVTGSITMVLQIDPWDPVATSQIANLYLYLGNHLLKLIEYFDPYTEPTIIKIFINNFPLSNLNMTLLYLADQQNTTHTTQMYIYNYSVNLF